MSRKLSEQFDREIGMYIERGIEEGIIDEILYPMD